MDIIITMNSFHYYHISVNLQRHLPKTQQQPSSKSMSAISLRSRTVPPPNPNRVKSAVIPPSYDRSSWRWRLPSSPITAPMMVGRIGSEVMAEVTLHLTGRHDYQGPTINMPHDFIQTGVPFQVQGLHLNVKGDEKKGITVCVRGCMPAIQRDVLIQAKNFIPHTTAEIHQHILKVLHCFQTVHDRKYGHVYVHVMNDLGPVMLAPVIDAIAESFSEQPATVPRVNFFIRQSAAQVVKRVQHGAHVYVYAEQRCAEDIIDSVHRLLDVNNHSNVTFDSGLYYDGIYHNYEPEHRTWVQVPAYQNALYYFNCYICLDQLRQVQRIVQSGRRDAVWHACIPRCGSHSPLSRLPAELIQLIVRLCDLDRLSSALYHNKDPGLFLKCASLADKDTALPINVPIGPDSLLRDIFAHDTFVINANCRLRGKAAEQQYVCH
jgi:hypothetical protein